MWSLARLPSALGALLLASSAFADGLVALPATSVGSEELPRPLLDKLTQLTRDGLTTAGATGPTRAIDEGRALVEKARQKYFDLDFKGAFAGAEAAISHYRNSPELLGDGSAYLTAHLLAGISQLELKNTALANAHFKQALIIKPDLSLSESDYSPTAIAALERARESLRATTERASLAVSSSPPFSALFIDGKSIGETPITSGDLLPGLHFVRVEHEGHTPATAWVELGAGRTPLTLELTASPTEALRAQVASAVAAGKNEELVSIARQLAEALNADAVVVLGAQKANDRVLVSAARVGRDGRVVRSYTSVSSSLIDAPVAIDRLAKSVLEDRTDRPRGLAEVGAAGALDFDKHLLGLRPPERKVIVEAPAPPPPPPTPLYKKPWIYAVGLAVIGGGAAAYLLTRGPAPAPGVGVTVSLPQ